MEMISCIQLDTEAEKLAWEHDGRATTQNILLPTIYFLKRYNKCLICLGLLFPIIKDT